MTAIQLGQACTLLFGYRPAWNPSGSVSAPFFAPPTDSTVTFPPTYVPPQYPDWSNTPYITIHDSAESLISAVYDYGVAPMTHDPAGIDVPVGPLELDDADRSAALAAEGAFLGLDLTANVSYMLVTFERIAGTAKHPFVADPSSADRSSYLTAAAKTAIAKLKPAALPDKGSVLYDSKITKADADGYVTQLYNLGTHFVSQLTVGDRLIQVFAYDAAHFKVVRDAFKTDATVQPDGSLAVTGLTASGWAYYTSQASGQFGFVKSYGHLVALSRDPALAAAIAAGNWASSYVPSGTPSIFAAATQYKLMLPLTQSVITAMTLAPIAELFTSALVAGPWDRLVKGGLLQLYGDSVVIPLPREIDYNWSSIFPDQGDSWTSQIVTPVIDVYQQRVDLAKVKLQGAQIVADNFPMKSFTSFSQVLQATTTADVPRITLPSDRITLIAQIIDTSQAVQTPVIAMSANAFQQFSVVCEDMYGSLIFEDASSGKRKVALDGFLFETQPAVDPATGRYKVDLSGVLSDAPSPALISSVKQSIEFSIVAGESLLQSSGPGSDVVRALEVSYLTWLAGIIPADTTDLDLATNRARALYIANDLATFSSDAVFVPYLTYESYNKYVGDLVTAAGSLNLTILNYQTQITNTINSYKVMDSIANLNDNVKQIGGVLTQYFQALASGRAAMDGYYASILAQLNQQLQQTLKDIVDLTGKLQAQQAVISQTNTPPGIVQRFETDYADYSKDQIAQAVVQGVTGLFDLGLAVFGIPEAAEGGVLKALEAFKEVYVQLHAVMQALQAIEDVEKATSGKIDKLNDMSAQISALSADGALEMPSQVDLLTLPQDVGAALAGVPDDPKLIQDKADLMAAVNTLVIIGTALLEAQTQASQTIVQIGNTNRLKIINGEQESKMAALVNALHLNDSTRPPDISSIDLIGVTGQLQFQLKQILLTLSQVLELQDGALQFEYFGRPAPITSFTLQNLLTVITSQDRNVINGLSQLNPQPQKVDQPITVTIRNVQASKLSGTNVFQFPIHLAATEFYNYDMVRIDRVVPNIKGIKSTTSGNFEIHLSCQAKPFQDRDYQRDARTYASTLRKFGPYVYNVATGVAEFGTNIGTFADKVTHTTPFSLWQISLPGDVANNQGIELDSLLVDVSVDFYVTAHYDDPVVRHQALLRRLSLAGFNTALLAASTTTDAPTLANLEAQMYQNQAVLQKWDAVFNVLEGPVNAFLYQQFQQYLAKLAPSNNTNLMTVSAHYCEDVQTFRGFWFTNVTKMTFQLSNPLLQFVAGNDSVTVIQNILSGTIATGTLGVTEKGFDPASCHLVSQDVTFTAAPATGTLSLSVAGVWENNMQVKVKSTGTLPAPLQANTDYWIVNWTNSGGKTTLQLSATAGGPPITFTDAGSGTMTIYPDIDWGNPVTVDVSKKPYVLASVALEKVSGIVEPPAGQGSASETHTVVVDFPKGAFVLNQFAVDPPNWDPSHHAALISNALASFYATNDIQYQVQTINYTNLTQNAALSPSKFVFHAVNTNAGNNVLQILIATTGEVQHAHTITLNEPVAYDPLNPVPGQSDFMVSLMIGTKLMFKDIFVGGFNSGGTNIQVAAVDPGVDFKSWSAKVTSGSATGPADFDNPYDAGGTKVNYRISASGNDITWSLVDMKFDRSQFEGVALNYSNGSATNTPPTGGTNVDFQYQQWIPPQVVDHGATIPGHWGNWQGASAMAYITMTGNYPLQVTGSGRSQVVKFSTVEPTVSFSKATDLKPASGCECNDNAIKIALLNSLGASVPKTLKEYIQKVTFQDISIFALESLLFPADQLITMKQARVPGDLLVVGSFLPSVRKTNPTYNVLISAATGAKGVFGTTSFQNGQGTGSATQNNLPKTFTFQYGPIDPVLGNLVTYTVNIDTGEISPRLIMVVDQPDPENNPQTVILLPPGFGPEAT